MDYEKLIEQLTPDMIANFRRAIELGKWPDGQLVTASQREHCMAAVIAYEQRYVDEQSRVGFIDRGSKAEGEQCSDELDPNVSQPLKWS